MQKLLKNKRGSIIILWAFLLPFVLAVIGIVTDYTIAYTNRSKLQQVADSSALAGAAEFQTDDISLSVTENINAIKLATAYITTNLPNSASILSEPAKFSITRPEGKPKRIDVALRQLSPTFFLQIFDIENIPISVHATAVGVNQPSIFDYALITTDEDKFILFGGGAPANTIYEGDIYTNSKNLYITVDGEITIPNNRLKGNVFCPNSLPKDFAPKNNHLKDKFFQKGAEKITMEYDSSTKKYKNKAVQDKIDAFKNAATTTLNHDVNDGNFSFYETNEYGEVIKDSNDNPIPKDHIYIKGDFEITPQNMGTNDLIKLGKSGKEVVIIAEGDINIKSAGTLPSTANITLCSITGNITFNGGTSGGAHFNCLAPNGTVDMDAGTVDMNGYIICKRYKVGNAGSIKHVNTSNSGTIIKSILKLVD